VGFGIVYGYAPLSVQLASKHFTEHFVVMLGSNTFCYTVPLDSVDYLCMQSHGVAGGLDHNSPPTSPLLTIRILLQLNKLL
jgi:hypothetical protein